MQTHLKELMLINSKSIKQGALDMIRGSVEEPHREWTSGPNKTDSILSELEMKR